MNNSKQISHSRCPSINDLLTDRRGKYVKIICKNGARIHCRVQALNMPYMSAEKINIKNLGSDLHVPWAVIDTNEFMILVPEEEIEE